jgi:hypothetical protein
VTPISRQKGLVKKIYTRVGRKSLSNVFGSNLSEVSQQFILVVTNYLGILQYSLVHV